MNSQNQGAYNAATTGKTGADYTSAVNNFFTANPGSATTSAVYGSPLYTPPQSGGQTSSSPVITSQGAQTDLSNKQDSFNTTQTNNIAQANAAQANKLSAAQQKTIDDNNALQSKIQQQNSQNETTVANAKAAAITGTANASTPTSTDTSTQSNPVTPNAPDTSGITNALNSNTSNYLGQQQDIQGQQDTLATQFNSALSNVISGTFPLSAPQQALISSLQQQLSTNTALQQNANDSEVGAARESALRSGGEYSPQEMANTIGNAVSTGVMKIQELDNSAASTMANLEQSFQKQDFDEINTQYQTLSKQLDDKSTSIKNMYDTVTSALQYQQTAAATAAKTAFDENLQSNQFNLTASQDQIDNMFKNAQINETQRHDMQDEANSAAQTQIAAQGEAIKDAEFNIQYGAFVNPDGSTNTNVQPSQIPGFTQSANGSSVILDTNGLYKTSSVGGIPVVAKDNVQAFTTNSNAASTINQMQILYSKLSGTDTNRATDLGTYNSLYNSLPSGIIKTVPTASEATGSPVFGGTDKALPMFSTALQNVNSTLSSLSPGYTPPPYGQTFTTPQSAQSYFTQTGQKNEYQAEVSKANSLAQSLYGRNANDGEIVQIINGQ